MSGELPNTIEDLRALVDGLPQIVWITRPDGFNLYCNQKWVDYTGLSLEATLGAGWIEPFHPDDRQKALEAWQLAVASADPYSDESRIRGADGSYRWWLIRGVPLRDAGGDIIKWFGTCTDIHDLKLAEVRNARTNAELVDALRRAGMAEVATGVLHNVGNVLNSVTVASSGLANRLRRPTAAKLSKVAGLLREHESDLGSFVMQDPRGAQIPGYLEQLAQHLLNEEAGALEVLAGLQVHIEHIRDIITTQQSLASVLGATSILSAAELVRDALTMTSLAGHRIAVTTDFGAVTDVTAERHKVLQILVNLLRNAEHACESSGRSDGRISIRTTDNGNIGVRISVCDNGVGIPLDSLARIFTRGFTTKANGHGFGLHSGALAAKQMQGSLTVESDGAGLGATFTLELPVSGRVHSDE